MRGLLLIANLLQLVRALISQEITYQWPRWVEICTFVSHFLLATGASVNILLYCTCDKGGTIHMRHPLSVVQRL